MAIESRKFIFMALLGLSMLPQESSAATYNAGISEIGFNNPSAQVGGKLNPFAVIRNLATRGIFTVYVDVMKAGQSAPVHSFNCRTSELANRAEFRCAGNFSTSLPGAYRVRARASSIGNNNFIFPGDSRYPGEKTSQPTTVADGASSQSEVHIDSFEDGTRYQGLHQNLLGGWTDDDGTLQLDSASGGALTLKAYNEAGYWYSVLASQQCFDASRLRFLKVVAKASQPQATVNLSFQTKDPNCAAQSGVSGTVGVTLEQDFKEIFIPLEQFKTADLSKLNALLVTGFQPGVEYNIKSISLTTEGGAATIPGVPAITEEFTANQGNWYTRLQPTGAITFGFDDVSAGDKKSLALQFPGNAALKGGANASPTYASEVGFNQKTHYGRYETRVKFATCAPTEEVVNGIFIYDNDGTDKNGNGLKDNTEIDFELLCGEPNVLWLTTWTDYSGDGLNQFRKKSRAIDMRTGDYRETPKGQEGNYDTFPAGNLPDVRIAGFPQSGTYYTIGFDWHPDRIRWYILVDGKQVTLWDLADTSVIPQRPATFMLNIWHSSSHWYNYGLAEYPDTNSTMYIDYFRFTPFQ